MNIINLTEVSDNTKKYFVKDLYSLTEKSLNICAEEGTLKSFVFNKVINNLPNTLTVKNVYHVNGKTLYLTSNGQFYEFYNRAYRQVVMRRWTNMPDVIPFYFQGKNGYAVIGDGDSVIVTDQMDGIGIPKADAYLSFNGDFYVAKGRRVLIMRSLSRNELYVDMDKKDVLNINSDMGSVLSLTEYGNEVLVFSTKGISKISISNNDVDFSLKSLLLPPIKCEKNSIKKVGDKVCFINSWKGLYYYKNGSIESVKTFLDGKDYTVTGKAFSIDGTYALPIALSSGEKYIFVKDLTDGEECLIDATDRIFTEEGYYVNYRTNETGKCGKEVANFQGKWESKEILFDGIGDKTVSALYATVRGNATLKIFGKNAERTMRIVDGENIVKTCVSSPWIKFVIESFSNDFELKNLSFLYRA